jgi:small subunit ribosomal protein S27e
MSLNETKTKFLKVKCSKCKNEQVLFERASNKDLLCLVCKAKIAQSTGGKINVTGGKIIKELN